MRGNTRRKLATHVMNVHEYQAKTLLRNYSIPTPRGIVVSRPEDVPEAVAELGGDAWILKAQIHAGGRGKAGGVQRHTSAEAMQQAAQALYGKRLVTVQNAPHGQIVRQFLIEAPVVIARELYFAMLLDRALERITLMVSSAGGMEIEQIAREHPEQIHRAVCDPIVGLQDYQARELAFGLGISGVGISAFTKLAKAAYRLFVSNDLSLLEINPLVLGADQLPLALDCKISIDDNALSRQPAINSLDDATQQDPREVEARNAGLNYVALDGSIGCMVNGAGLAMATMDLIAMHGGAPANFLDVGGGANAETVSSAFKILLSDANVKSVFVNIFGGIMRCDVIAEGIIAAVREVDVKVPVIVRLEGTNVAQGRALLAESGLQIIAANDLTDAARRAVEAAA